MSEYGFQSLCFIVLISLSLSLCSNTHAHKAGGGPDLGNTQFLSVRAHINHALSLCKPLDEIMLMYSTLYQDKQSTTFNFMHIITTPALVFCLMYCLENDDVM